MSGNFLLIYIRDFHVLNHLLLIYIFKLHLNRLFQNWHAKDCPTEEELRSRNSSLPSQRDMDLLASPTVKLVSELNADQQRPWDYIK